MTLPAVGLEPYGFTKRTDGTGLQINETVLLSTQNMFRLLSKKIIAILRSKFCLTGPMDGPALEIFAHMAYA